MATKGSPKREEVNQSTSPAFSLAAQNRPRQTSPITIGGGSVSIDFHHGHYLRSGRVFTKVNDEIDTVWVYDENNSIKWDLLDFVLGKDCVLTVHTMVASSRSDIVIKSKPGGPLSVEFEDGQFPLATGSDRRHFNRDRKIVDMIEVKDNGDMSTATFSVPSAGKCLIVVVNKF